MFYDNFIGICETKGFSPTRVLIELGMSKGSLQRWKEGGSPRNEYKKKIADFFGITVSELTTGKKENPTLVSENGVNDDIDSTLADMLRKLTPEQADKVRCFVQGMLSSK